MQAAPVILKKQRKTPDRLSCMWESGAFNIYEQKKYSRTFHPVLA